MLELADSPRPTRKQFVKFEIEKSLLEYYAEPVAVTSLVLEDFLPWADV